MNSALHVVFDNKHWTKPSTDSLWWLVRYNLKESICVKFGHRLWSLKIIIILKFNMGQAKRAAKGRGVLFLLCLCCSKNSTAGVI